MIDKFIYKIKANWHIVILAAIFGFLIVFPTIYTIHSIGWENFRGIYPVFNKDEVHYLAMTKEVADGYSGLGNTFIAEYKVSPGIQSSLAEIILASCSKLFHVSVSLLFVINDFLSPFIGFILLYIFFRRTVGHDRLAVFFTALFYLFFLYTFGRPINPQFSFIFLAIGLILIGEIFNENTAPPRRIKYALGLGGIIGILVYIYPYFWTALVVLFVVNLLLGWFLFRRINKLKPALFMLPVFAILSVPYIINSLKAATHPFYAETILRFGLLDTHWPACYVNAAVAIFTLFILFLSKRCLRRSDLFFAASFPLSALILNWQNVISGKYLQFSSHYYQVTILSVVICLAIILSRIIPKMKKREERRDYKIFVILGLTILLFVFIAYRQRGEIVKGFYNPFPAGQVAELQELATVFDWLNENTAPDSVVMTNDDDLAGYLSVYTLNNNYNFGYAGYYLISDDEIEDRWIRQNIFKDNAVDSEYIFNNNRGIWLNKFIDNYQNRTVREKIFTKLTGKNAKSIEYVPGFYIDRVEKKYEEVKKQELLSALKKYKLDYIILDKGNGKYAAIDGELSKYDEVDRIAEIGERVIYQIK
ncbi:MAG: hypothetical protein V1867_06190 [Candidatus Falkowbacteria bacterium]